MRSVIALYGAENPAFAEIAQRDAPFAGTYLDDGSAHMVAGRDGEGNYGLGGGENLPPGIIPDFSVHRLMAGARLNEAAVLEAVDADPGRGERRFYRRLYIRDDPVGGYLPVAAFFAGNGITAPVA